MMTTLLKKILKKLNDTPFTSPCSYVLVINNSNPHLELFTTTPLVDIFELCLLHTFAFMSIHAQLLKQFVKARMLNCSMFPYCACVPFEFQTCATLNIWVNWEAKLSTYNLDMSETCPSRNSNHLCMSSIP